MTPIEKYRQLAQKLLRGQANDTLSIMEESHILGELDECWWQMSVQERTEIEREIAEAKKIAHELEAQQMGAFFEKRLLIRPGEVHEAIKAADALLAKTKNSKDPK